MTIHPMIPTRSAGSSASLYDGLAASYDRAHRRFLRLAGAEAQCAFEGALTALLRPGLRVLDAGCGTGRLARRLLAAEPGLDLTLLDAAPAMLRRSAGLPARRVHGDLAAMPFEGSSFDIVACAWALETLDDPGAGLRELVRVLRPGGRACVACCADRPGMDALDRLATMAMRLRGTGRLLSPSDLVAGAGPGTRVRPIPCGGPAAVLLMEKPS